MKFPASLVPALILGAVCQSSAAENILEELVVTAQKREQNLQDVPISVSVVSGEVLQAMNKNQLSELSKVVPGFTFAEGTSDAGKSVLIRGVGTQSFSRGVEQSVGTVVDEVVVDGLVTSQLDLNDMARVEVLRGPQGMLFGKNASVGVLNITTNAPTQEFAAGLGASYADENEIKLNAYVSGPLVDDAVLGRLSAYSNKRDAIVENLYPGGSDFNDRDEWGVRGKLLFIFTDQLDAKIGYFHAERDHSCCAPVPVKNTAGGIPESDNSPEGKENDKVLENDDTTGSTETDVYSLAFNYGFSDHIFTSISAYSESNVASNFRVDGSTRTTLPINEGDSDSEQFTQEFRITSPSDNSLTYVAGLYYYDKEQKRDFTRIIDTYGVGLAPAPGLLLFSLINNVDVQRESYSAFGELTWNVSERASLTLGARYDDEEVSVSQFVGFLPGTLPEATPGTFDSTESDQAWSGRLIGQFDLADDKMIYASAARGYKGLGANTLASSEIDVERIIDPEIPTSYEIGIKSLLLEQSVRLNAAVFYSTFDDFQATLTDLSVPPGFYLVSAGEMETQGFELELQAQLSERFFLTAAVAYVDATFADFEDAGCYAGQTPEQGCTDGSQDLSGADMPNSPDWSYTITGRYDHPFESMPFDGFINGSWYWQDEVQYSTENNPILVGDSYGLADLSFGVAGKDGTYSVNVFIKNVFDEFYVSSLGAAPAFGVDKNQGLNYDYKRRFGIATQLSF